MKFKYLMLFLVILIFLISACNTQQSTIKEKSTEQVTKAPEVKETPKTNIIKQYGQPDKKLGGISGSPTYTDQDTRFQYTERWLYYLKSSQDPKNPDRRVVFFKNGELSGTAIFYNDGRIDKNEKNNIDPKPKSPSNYNANLPNIRTELTNKGYEIVQAEFSRNPNNKYVLAIAINTKGNYDKETLDMFRAGFNNAVADYYLVGISDYELNSVWSFTATRKTLDDYFSGRITESEYIRQVETERLI